MDWIHCNLCFYQPGQVPKRDFKLTNCGHIFCSYCERSGTIELCKVCNNKCSSTPLSANMAKEVQLYFEEPEKMLTDQVLKVMVYQKGHRQKLNENYRKIVEKYQLAKHTIQKLQEKAIFLERKLEEERKSRSNNSNTFLTPSPKSQFPAFRSSQASNAGSSIFQASASSRSPVNVFTTPSSQHYRHKPMSPSPLSSVSSVSPMSVFSKSKYGNSNSQSYQQLTPPLHNLSLLSVHNTKSRSNSRY